MHVFVLDALSRDHTVQFARGAGAEVVQREWTDFVDARTFALAHVKTPWTLMLEADEALDDVLRDAIVACDGTFDAYRIKRTTYFCGKPMRIWRDEPLIRLFRTDRTRLEAHPAAGGRAMLHERWVCDGTIGELPGTLLHFSYQDVASYRTKYARYTTAEARGLEGSPVRAVAASAKSAAKFAYLLLARGALLDGPRGVYVAYRSATYPAAVEWKALLQRPE